MAKESNEYKDDSKVKWEVLHFEFKSKLQWLPYMKLAGRHLEETMA